MSAAAAPAVAAAPAAAVAAAATPSATAVAAVADPAAAARKTAAALPVAARKTADALNAAADAAAALRFNNFRLCTLIRLLSNPEFHQAIEREGDLNARGLRIVLERNLDNDLMGAVGVLLILDEPAFRELCDNINKSYRAYFALICGNCRKYLRRDSNI